MRSTAVLICALLLALGLGACSRLTDVSPSTQDTVQILVGNFRLATDAKGGANFDLDTLLEAYDTPFTIRGVGFTHGHLVVNQRTLRYQSFDNNWTSDTGRIELYQLNTVHTAQLILHNGPFPADTSTCTEASGLLYSTAASTGQTTIWHAPEGFKITEARADYYGAGVSADSTALIFLADRGLAPTLSLNLAKDRVYVRVTGHNACQSQYIQVGLGDTCRATFKGYTITQLSGAISALIPQADITYDMRSCTGAQPTGVKLRLTMEPYSGSKTIQLPNGVTLTDSTDNALYFRFTGPVKAQQFPVFVEEGADKRLSTGLVTLQP